MLEQWYQQEDTQLSCKMSGLLSLSSSWSGNLQFGELLRSKNHKENLPVALLTFLEPSVQTFVVSTRSTARGAPASRAGRCPYRPCSFVVAAWFSLESVVAAVVSRTREAIWQYSAFCWANLSDLEGHWQPGLWSKGPEWLGGVNHWNSG